MTENQRAAERKTTHHILELLAQNNSDSPFSRLGSVSTKLLDILSEHVSFDTLNIQDSTSSPTAAAYLITEAFWRILYVKEEAEATLAVLEKLIPRIYQEAKAANIGDRFHASILHNIDDALSIRSEKLEVKSSSVATRFFALVNEHSERERVLPYLAKRDATRGRRVLKSISILKPTRRSVRNPALREPNPRKPANE